MDEILSSIQYSRRIQISIVVCAALFLAHRVLSPAMIFASGSYFLLVLGYSFRKQNLRLHSSLMTLAIVGDLTLVLILEIKRHAIQTAISFSLSPLQQLHIFCSSVATVLYLPTLIIGPLLYFKPELRARLRNFHIRIASTAFVFRTLGFLLMFSMLKKGN